MQSDSCGGTTQAMSPPRDHEGEQAPRNRAVDIKRDISQNHTALTMGSLHSNATSEKFCDELSQRENDDDLIPINDDVYNMFFLSNIGGQAFYYAVYIFIFKLALYTFLVLEAIETDYPRDMDIMLVITQFLMLPVAVAMQEDLMATFYLVANIKFSPALKVDNPDACKWKFHVANFCRGIDGVYSLVVNFLILVKGDNKASVFLNFAALQFLQTIDNIALKLAEDGFLTERLEEVAKNVQKARLPKKNTKAYQLLDSVLFIATLFVLTAVLLCMHFIFHSYDNQPAIV